MVLLRVTQEGAQGIGPQLPERLISAFGCAGMVAWVSLRLVILDHRPQPACVAVGAGAVPADRAC